MSRRYAVALSARAQNDLDTIDEYLLKNASDDLATQTRAELINAIRDLSHLPYRFVKIESSDARRQHLHRRVVYPYLIFYQIDEPQSKVTVAFIRHGRRRPLKPYS